MSVESVDIGFLAYLIGLKTLSTGPLFLSKRGTSLLGATVTLYDRWSKSFQTKILSFLNGFGSSVRTRVVMEEDYGRWEFFTVLIWVADFSLLIVSHFAVHVTYNCRSMVYEMKLENTRFVRKMVLIIFGLCTETY